VVADRDGTVIVPRRLAHEVVQRCERLLGVENAVRKAIRRGMTPLAAYEKFGVF
jgi:regulator of RNase E activity RraA